MSNQDPLPTTPVGRSQSAPRRHILSVDVEDYFQVEAFADRVHREDWEGFPSRVEQNTMRLLDLFDEFKVKATFFLVGWVADRSPNLVREIVARGHEPACHSYWHRTVYSLTPEEFREDTRKSKDRIEQMSGMRVLGYRAPTWSITRTCLWALDILAELGFEYDSSIYPIQHDLYGLPGAGRLPYTHQLAGGQVLREFPPATVKLAGMILPAAGGGYLRIFPLAYTHWAFRQMEHHSESPVIVYLHPWEVDPEQPRIQGQLKSKFRHYTNLHKMTSRLRSMLGRYSFWAFRDLLAASKAEPNIAPLIEVKQLASRTQ